MSDYLSHRSRTKRDEGVYIPSDLWPEILKRVPARKLLQLQCVCKSWNSLISSSSLVSSHNLNTITSTANVTSRLRWTTKCHVDVTNYGFRFAKEQFCALQNHNKFTPLGFPRIPSYRIRKMCSSADMLHGVIFLRYIHVDDSNESLLCVWNPCIRKQVILPWPMARGGSDFRLEGAWFDAANNDLKVIRSQLKSSYDLLSVRNGVWRMKLPFPRSCIIRAGRRLSAVNGVFFDGSIHWIVGPDTTDEDQIARGPYKLLRFDCEREEFNLMDIPSQLVQGLRSEPILCLLDLGAATMLSLVKLVCESFYCELWLMQPGLSSWARLDRNHPKFAAAASATRDVISCSGLAFQPLPLHHHAHFKLTDNCMEKFYHFKETMMLMDIGNPSIHTQLNC